MLEQDSGQRDFVETALQPLPEDEALRDLLETSVGLAASAPTRGDTPEKAAARMRKTARAFIRRRRAGQVAWVVSAMLVSWFALFSPSALRGLRNISDANLVTAGLTPMCCSEAPPILPRPGGFDFETGWKTLEKRQASRWPAERRLAAFGDLSRDDPARWQAAYDAYPDDPAQFLAYAFAYHSVHRRWPDGFVDTGERLDPENGWFRLLHAAGLARASVRENPAARRGGSRRAAPAPPEIIVTDPEVFREAEEQMARALAMPRWDDYRDRMYEARLKGWTQPRDFTEHSLDQILRYIHPAGLSENWGYVGSLADWFRAAIRDASRAEDRRRLDALADSFRGTAGKLAAMPWGEPVVRQASIRAFVAGVSRSLADAYGAFGEAEETRRFGLAADRLDARKNPRKRPVPDALSERRGSSLASISAGSRSPASKPVTEEELRGGRLAEYAMYERLLMHLLAIALCATTVFLLCASLAFRGELGSLPARVAGLLTWRDRAAVLAASVGLPALVYGVSTRWPVLGEREFSLSAAGFFAWLVQVAALWLSVVLGAMQAGRWRLARRGAVMALGWRGFDPGWICWLAALGAMPVAAATQETLGRWLGDEGYGIAALWGLLGMPALWLAMVTIVHFNGLTARRLHRTALVRAMIPPVVCASLAAAGAIPLIYAEERKRAAEIRYDPSEADTRMAGWIGGQVADALCELDGGKPGRE